MDDRLIVYQIYPRSFAPDLAAIRARLAHVASLGAGAVWLSPIHPSPNVDWGYDVADYGDVHPDFGDLADHEALIAEARRLGLDVWLDLVPNHTSDRHRWFGEQPEYYVWSKRVPNDWRSIFTGRSAWTYDERRGRYYLHQFAPQQPDLDWWSPDVRAEFERILRFWFDRGVRGLRIDVAHALVKDRRLRDGVSHMRDRPEVHDIYRRWQEIAAAYDPKPVLMGETYVPLDDMFAYYRHLDLAQNFTFLKARFELGRLRPVVEETLRRLPPGRRACWFGSNHDHSRMATRWAKGDPRRHRAALFLLLTLPGVAILYQGDELGLEDGRVPRDRVRDVARPPRDRARTPMPWTRGGEEWPDPWLPLSDTSRNVADEDADPGSILNYTRDLARARRSLPADGYVPLESPPGIWAYRRGGSICALNLSGRKRRFGGATLEPWEGTIV